MLLPIDSKYLPMVFLFELRQRSTASPCYFHYMTLIDNNQSKAIPVVCLTTFERLFQPLQNTLY